MLKEIKRTAVLPELKAVQSKFTSKPGRTRRARLLEATQELLLEKLPPDDITFAMVCQRAEIPRASAYHFFSNVNALFLTLALVHAERLANAIVAVDVNEFASWQDYMFALIDVGERQTGDDLAFLQLNYGRLGESREARELGYELDQKIILNTYQNLCARFDLPDPEQLELALTVTFTIIDAIFALSYRRHTKITPEHVAEAKRATVAYLRAFIPEALKPRAVNKTRT